MVAQLNTNYDRSQLLIRGEAYTKSIVIVNTGAEDLDLVAGAVLGRDATGKYNIIDESTTGTAALPKVILVQDVTVPTGSEYMAEGYVCGTFNKDLLTFSGTVTLETVVNGEMMEDHLQRMGLLSVAVEDNTY